MHEKILSLTNQRGNENQNHGETSPHTCYTGVNKAAGNHKRCWGCGERGHVSTIGEHCKSVQSLWKTLQKLLKKLKVGHSVTQQFHFWVFVQQKEDRHLEKMSAPSCWLQHASQHTETTCAHQQMSGSHTHTLTHTNAITSWLPPWGSGTQYNSGPFERHVGHTQWCPPGGVRLLFIHQLPSSLLGDHQTWGHHLQNSQGCRKKPSSREMLVLEVRCYQHVWEQFSDQKSTSKVQPWRHGKGRHCLPAERNWHYPHFPDGDLKAQRG